MKYIGKVKSNRGHGEIYYIFRVSPLELKVLKKLVLSIARLDKKGNIMRCAHISIRKELSKIK